MDKKADLSAMAPKLLSLLRRGAGYAVRHPFKTSGNILKGTAGALALPALGEFGGKTVYNIATGNPSLGNANWTGGQIGNALNQFGNVTGVSPMLSAGVRDIAEGAFSSPSVQKALNAAEQLSNPANQAMMKDTLVSSVSDAAGAASKSLVYGSLEGAGQAFLDKPAPVMATALGLGAGPLVAYDLVTRKRREQQERTNQAILSYVNRAKAKENNEKSAGVVDLLKRFGSKVIHRPSTMPVEDLYHLAHMAQDGRVDISRVIGTANKSQPQTLLNSTISRHPLKSLAIGAAGIGAGHGAYETFKNPYPDSGDFLGKAVLGTVKGPAQLIGSIEAKGLSNDNYKKIMDAPQAQQLLRIRDNLLNDPNATKPTEPVSVSGALPPMDPLGKPKVTNDVSLDTKKLKPFLSAAGLLLAPYVAYEAYDRMVNKKRKNIESKNERLATKLTQQ